MAVKSFPNVSPDANPSFTLESNTSSFESSLNKSVQHMELLGARWRGSVAFSNRTRQEANKIKAFMTSLGGQVGRFYLTPFDAYQSGTMSGTGVVDGALSSGVSSIPTKGWEADQDALFEAGDYIEVNGELKLVTGDVSAPQSYIEYTDTNYMPSPFDPSGWKPDSDGTITNVTLANPSGSSVIGLAEQTGAGPFTFFSSLDNPQDFLAGDKLYCAFIYKRVDTWEAGCFIGFNKTGSQIASARIDIRNNTYPNGNVDEVKFTDLGNDFVLVEAMETLTADALGCFAVATFTDMVNAPAQPPIGSQLYVQAAYFGKADDYPAQLLATADIPIAPPLRKSLTGDESIITNEPKGKFYLGSNDQSWDINVNGVQSMGFDFIEDVN